MKNAIITGSEGGIGIELCQIFADSGYRVIGIDSHCKMFAHDSFHEIDLSQLVADNSYFESVVGGLIKNLGSGLHVLVNNAAIQILGGTEELDIEQWNKTLSVNLLAPFLLTKAMLPFLRQVSGSVVNIGSIHSRLTKPGFIAYATSKSALDGLTRSMAVDLAPEVRVNAVSPAATETEMLVDSFRQAPEKLDVLKSYHPLARIAAPAEIAQAARFLSSEAAAFITGEILEVGGGIGVRLHDPS